MDAKSLNRKAIVLVSFVLASPICGGQSAGALAATNSVPLPAAGQPATNRPTARELLQWFDEEQGKLNSFIAQYELSRQNSGVGLPGGKSSYSIAGETRFAGRQCSVRTRAWGQVMPTRQWTKDKPNYDSFLYDGQWLYHYGHFFWRLEDVPKGEPVGSLILTSGKDVFAQVGESPSTTNLVEILSVCASPLTFCLGVPPLDWKRFDIRIRDAASLRVRDHLEPAGAELFRCYVLEADTPQGRYTVWLDPTHGYQMAKLILERLPGHQRTTPNAPYTLTAGEHDLSTVDQVRFAKYGGVWMLVEASTGLNMTIVKVGSIGSRTQFKVTKFLLNPDQEALGSFLPDDIRNGSIVATGLATNGSGGLILCRWHDGQALDPKGKVVFDSGLRNTNSAKSSSTGKD